MAEPIVFHIDVNSAFLSWTAAYRRLVLGRRTDLRQIPSVIACDGNSRTSIVLAKSIPAKKYGIQTGEPLGMARQKCPTLVVAEPDYALYVTASRKLMALLREISPCVEQYSIDEAWVDMTGSGLQYGPPVLAAQALAGRIRSELGYTVNIGISCNKLLAKMAGDFEKPDKVHTLFPKEIPEKLWPLPVTELFGVGRATAAKLADFGVTTIGQLAQCEPSFLRRKFGKMGVTLWQFANGRGTEQVFSQPPAAKGCGNSVTTPRDVTDMAYAKQVLLSLCETVGMRLRRSGQSGSRVSIHLRSSDFRNWSHQKRLGTATNVTEELYRSACELLQQTWDGRTPLRQLGVQVSDLSGGECRQCSLFDDRDYARQQKLDAAVDELREKYGENALFRAVFLKEGAENLAGGLSPHRRTGITKPLEDGFSLL